jgi:hypothetical protein
MYFHNRRSPNLSELDAELSKIDGYPCDKEKPIFLLFRIIDFTDSFKCSCRHELPLGPTPIIASRIVIKEC